MTYISNWLPTLSLTMHFSTITWSPWQQCQQPAVIWQCRSTYCCTYSFWMKQTGVICCRHIVDNDFSPPKKDNTILSAVKEVSFFTVELWNLIKVMLLTFSGNIYPAINHTTCQRDAALQGTITTTHVFCCFSSRCTSTCISIQMYRRPLADHRHFLLLPRCPLAVRLLVTWCERATEDTTLPLRSFVLIKLSWNVALSLLQCLGAHKWNMVLCSITHKVHHALFIYARCNKW